MYIESKDDFRIDSYDAFKNTVHSIIRSPVRQNVRPTFLAADQNRYVNLYDVEEKKIVRTLVAGGEIDRMAIYDPDLLDDSNFDEQILAIVTREGLIDLFSQPFAVPETRTNDVKTRRKALTRKANATVKLINDDASKSSFPAFSVSFDGPNLIIASVEGGAEPVFQKLRWQDEGSGELLFEGTRLVPRARPASATNAVNLNGAKDMGRVHVNEARAVVTNGIADAGSQAAPLEIESDSDNEEEVDDEEQEEVKEASSEAASDDSSDEEMQDAETGLELVNGAGDDQEADEEPSFGDILAARHPEAISIMNSLPSDQNALTTFDQSRQSMLPSGLSLGTVLTQSLKTNDQSLLETCLHVNDENVIRNTLLRLDSSLAANLLTKLAERLADRPGRYGHLLTWIQLTMVAHGGAIASQADVASKLRTLYQVLNERGRVLPSILLLKGKLDMMNAQQEFRAQAEVHRKGIESAGTTLHIEGQEDDWSSDEDLDAPAGRKSKSKSRVKRDFNDLIGGAESSEDEGMPLVNGGFHSDDDEVDDSDEDAPHHPLTNGVLDDEAEVSGEEEDDDSGSEEDDSNGDEEDDDDEEDSSMEDFINDGEISEVADEDDVVIDEEPQRPAKKKSKHR